MREPSVNGYGEPLPSCKNFLVVAAGKADISPRERKHVLSWIPRRRYIHSEGSSKRGQWRSSIDGFQKWMVAIDPATGRQTARRYYQLEEDPKEPPSPRVANA